MVKNIGCGVRSESCSVPLGILFNLSLSFLFYSYWDICLVGLCEYKIKCMHVTGLSITPQCVKGPLTFLNY